MEIIIQDHLIVIDNKKINPGALFYTDNITH